jgi:hypothetical protein
MYNAIRSDGLFAMFDEIVGYAVLRYNSNS